MKRTLALATLALAAMPLLAQKARVVDYHQNDIVPIREKVGYAALIRIEGHGEKFIKFIDGDPMNWHIDLYPTFCSVAVASAKSPNSNMHLITDKRVYSFELENVSTSKAEPDQAITLRLIDQASTGVAEGAPDYVPADELERMQAELQQAQQQNAAMRAGIPALLDQAKATAEQTPPVAYNFKHNDKTFAIQNIWSDGRMTYIQTAALEKFAVYEIKDGKPSLISYELQKGTYVIPKVVDRGYLEIGEKHFDFIKRS